MRFNIMMLITFYYFKMASEELINRKRYLILKKSMIVLFLTINSIFFACAITLFKNKEKHLCIQK